MPLTGHVGDTNWKTWNGGSNLEDTTDMQHQESKIQQACVTWFRYQYPHLAFLLFHPKNEGHGDRIAGAIAKAEGVVPGVPDLILAIPSVYHCMLCLEMKTPRGRQSDSQRRYQAYAETATAEYHVIRDVNTFQDVVMQYLSQVPVNLLQRLHDLHCSLEQADMLRNKARLKKLLKNGNNMSR